ncbi:hypothetical protein ACFLVQ_01015 [Chloroflexota bacterium]
MKDIVQEDYVYTAILTVDDIDVEVNVVIGAGATDTITFSLLKDSSGV